MSDSVTYGLAGYAMLNKNYPAEYSVNIFNWKNSLYFHEFLDNYRLTGKTPVILIIFSKHRRNE